MCYVSDNRRSSQNVMSGRLRFSNVGVNASQDVSRVLGMAPWYGVRRPRLVRCASLKKAMRTATDLDVKFHAVGKYRDHIAAMSASHPAHGKSLLPGLAAHQKVHVWVAWREIVLGTETGQSRKPSARSHRVLGFQ